MDKDNFQMTALLGRLKPESSLHSQKESSQQLLAALFFITLGLILTATGFVSLLLRLADLIYVLLVWTFRQFHMHRPNRSEQLRRAD